jgi:porphobilinogen synthase
MSARPRRTRVNSIVRGMVAETRLSKDMFIYPYFVVDGKGVKKEIGAMPGVYHFSIDELIKDIREGLELGIDKVLLFGVGEEKSEDGTTSCSEDSIVAKAVAALKDEFEDELYVITDVCVCAYTTHGHCGVLEEGYVQNDESVDVLAQMALTHAEAGADMVAPSDMMDGRVEAIRDTLDDAGFETVAIMSYSVKFASAYYGPFREAANSSPGEGDRKSYQMDFRNRRESLKEAGLDEDEGADIVMIKPALAYLDIITEVREQTNLPVACYNVSGEYSMVKAAAAAGFVDEQAIVMENMYAFARSGADIIITYHAKDILSKGWM